MITMQYRFPISPTSAANRAGLPEAHFDEDLLEMGTGISFRLPWDAPRRLGCRRSRAFYRARMHPATHGPTVAAGGAREKNRR